MHTSHLSPLTPIKAIYEHTTVIYRCLKQTKKTVASCFCQVLSKKFLYRDIRVNLDAFNKLGLTTTQEGGCTGPHTQNNKAQTRFCYIQTCNGAPFTPEAWCSLRTRACISPCYTPHEHRWMLPACRGCRTGWLFPPHTTNTYIDIVVCGALWWQTLT